MSKTLIEKLVLGEKITTKEIENELYEICDRVHSGCDNGCPVYRLNGGDTPDTVQDFEVNRGCDCFKSGSAMRKFILKHSKPE